jgi:DNA-binding GntR family transcriptional regulator
MGQVAARGTSSEGGRHAGAKRLGDLAYVRILETLFDRKIPTGAFLSQQKLVQLLGITVAPLRHALSLLEAEGIVTIHPRSGVRFIKPGFELARSTYQYRSIIESAAAAVYAETANEAEMPEIERRHLALMEVVEREGLTERNRRELEEIETLLHNSIVRSLSNPLIERSYRRLHNYVRLIRLDRNITEPLVLRSLREHLRIIEACKMRDSEAAGEAMRAHLNAALQRSLGLYGS